MRASGLRGARNVFSTKYEMYNVLVNFFSVRWTCALWLEERKRCTRRRKEGRVLTLGTLMLRSSIFYENVRLPFLPFLLCTIRSLTLYSIVY